MEKNSVIVVCTRLCRCVLNLLDYVCVSARKKTARLNSTCVAIRLTPYSPHCICFFGANSNGRARIINLFLCELQQPAMAAAFDGIPDALLAYFHKHRSEMSETAR